MSNNESATPPEAQENIRKFTFLLAIAATVLAGLPTLLGFINAGTGELYLGSQFNLDDHMVYAAWMRQAMDGQFFFDNRFAVDPQPGLTVHLYFWILGLVAKLVSIPIATTIARLGFTFLFIILFGRLLTTLNFRIFTAKFALLMATFGAGLGYIQWEPFGRVVTVGNETFLSPILRGRLSIDVWQPEAFVFPSMLTNGLFMVSLCLIILVFTAIVKAKEGWKPVLPGALAMAALMNIHSYDVLLIALVLIGFLVATVFAPNGENEGKPTLEWPWIGRAAVICAGAIPPALYFMYVLSQDEVFQARAATLTYSPTFLQLLFGILPAVAFGLGSLARKRKPSPRELGGLALFTLVVIGLSVASYGHNNPEAYFLTPATFGLAFIAVLGSIALTARKDPAWNLFWAWAAIGLIAPYFPGLFQRKLAMGLAIPWGVMAAFGVATIADRMAEKAERQARNLVSALSLIILSASSLYWFQREILLINNNVATTTVQPVYFSNDVRQIINELNKVEGRKVVIAIGGIPMPNQEAGFPFLPPYIPDINPLLSGLAGAYTYAGHWSETPNHVERLSQVNLVYSQQTNPADRETLLDEMKVDYIVAPDPSAFDQIPLADLSQVGTKIYDGPQFDLYERN